MIAADEKGGTTCQGRAARISLTTPVPGSVVEEYSAACRTPPICEKHHRSSIVAEAI